MLILQIVSIHSKPLVLFSTPEVPMISLQRKDMGVREGSKKFSLGTLAESVRLEIKIRALGCGNFKTNWWYVIKAKGGAAWVRGTGRGCCMLSCLLPRPPVGSPEMELVLSVFSFYVKCFSTTTHILVTKCSF